MPDPAAPPPEAPSVEIDTDAFSSALQTSAPQIGNPAGAVPPAEAKPAEPPAIEEKPKTEEKPATTEKKKGLAALSEEKVEEKKKNEEEKSKADAEEPEIDTSKWQKPQQQAFAAMRAEKKRMEEQVKTAQLKAEKLERDLQAAKSNPTDRPETLEKLQRLENWEKAQDLRRSEEWKTAVERPIAQSLAVLNKIATRAKVDPEKLAKATDITDDLDRYDAIAELFGAAEEPVPAHLVNAAIDEAKKLHPLYAKAAELEKNAKETVASLNHQTEQQKQAAAKAAEAEYVKHHDHVYGQMAEKMKSLFAEEAVAAEVKAARPGTDPADRAYEAQAAAILPVLWEKFLAVRDEAAKEKAAKLALLGTRATVTPSTTSTAKPANADDVELDEAGLDAALKNRG